MLAQILFPYNIIPYNKKYFKIAFSFQVQVADCPYIFVFPLLNFYYYDSKEYMWQIYNDMKVKRMGYRLSIIFLWFSGIEQADRYVIKHTPELNFNMYRRRQKQMCGLFCQVEEWEFFKIRVYRQVLRELLIKNTSWEIWLSETHSYLAHLPPTTKG